MYLLDTNTCIFLINKKPQPVLERLKSVLDSGVSISSITVAELQFGVYNSIYVEKNRIALAEFLAPFPIRDFNGSIRSNTRIAAKAGPPDRTLRHADRCPGTGEQSDSRDEQYG